MRLAPYGTQPVSLTVRSAPAAAWQYPPGATGTVSGSDLSVTFPPGAGPGAGILRPADGPAVLPVVSTGPLPPDGLFAPFDLERPVPATVAATVARLPRLGRTGTLVDLDYADRLATSSTAPAAEVWLSSSAPPSLVDALAAAGLTVDARRTVADLRTRLAGEGSALGLRFYLVAGVLAVVLAAAALFSGTVEASSGDLKALRAQGLAARRAATVEPVAAVLLVVVAGLIAVPAAAAAWAAAVPPPLTGLPPTGPPALALAAAVLALAVVAALTTARRR
ncbi:hypothetical protein GCM10010170_051410 [Dactylosporangium salmoneum]|uniref:FtsX-like permease family protein n=1 Tax=Dactylosporangium salmoneum TaxID=53361 RepID=A0ABP5TR03_9ACTN